MKRFIELLEFILQDPVLKNSSLFLQFLGLNQDDFNEDFQSDSSIESYITAMQL